MPAGCSRGTWRTLFWKSPTKKDLRWTGRMKFLPGPASRTGAKSPERPHEHFGHDLYIHPRHLHGRGGDRAGADGAAYAADVRGERDSRDCADRGRDCFGQGGRPHDCFHAGFHRGDFWGVERGGRICGDGQDAGDVQSQSAGKGQRRQMSRTDISEGAYLVASLLFILGLKRLSSPRTARSGNLVAAIGMALALGGTFILPDMGNFGWIILAIGLGAIPGWLRAKSVKMTAMPQMVSLFNGMGGACALFISLGEWLRGIGIDFPWTGVMWGSRGPPDLPFERVIAHSGPMLLGIVLGAISFTGSLVAFGKLEGLISEKPLRWPLQKPVNILVV